jgi:hypothetical protein
VYLPIIGGEMNKPEYLGKDARGYYYILDTDLYVYQFNGAGKFLGWLCSFPAWERTFFHIIV